MTGSHGRAVPDVLFRVPAGRARALTPADVPALQRLFDHNPDDFLTLYGDLPAADEAMNEFAEPTPAWQAFERKWTIGFEPAAGPPLFAAATVLAGFDRPEVWHIGLFLLDARRRGGRMGHALIGELERWMVARGAAWARVAVVAGHTAAERFWTSLGYAEVRQRRGVPTGRLTSTLRVCVKPLAGGTLDAYLALVERDRPDSALP